MIHLVLNKAHMFEPNEVMHIRVKTCETLAPGKWKVTADIVTPLPGAEPPGYACHFCGVIEPAQDNGSLPEGWKERKYEQGSFFGCPDCKDLAVCRKCGCTDNNACPDGCFWVEEDLCSACE